MNFAGIDLAKMPLEEKVQLLELLEQKEKHLRENKLAYYQPYKKQRDFHAAGAIKGVRERLLMAGNQLGKCISGHTKVDTPKGPVRAMDLREGDMVYAWDGKKVAVRCSQPFKKAGLHDTYLVVMSDGRWFEAADHHRILTSSGWKLISELLPESEANRLASTLASDQSAHGQDVRRLSKKAQGLMGRCSAGLYLCGERLLSAIDTVRGLLPSRDDAPRHNGHIVYSDGQVGTGSGILLSESTLPASRDVVRRYVGRIVGWLAQASYRCVAPSLLRRQASALLRGAANIVLRSMGAVSLQAQDVWFSGNGPLATPDVDGNRIIAVVPIGRHEVYDMTVQGLHNYCAAGVVHHNTLGAGAEAAMHLTGRYPDWWQGKRFDHPVTAWAASVTSQGTRDTIQRILLGPPGEWGTGMIPKECLIDIKRTAHGVPDSVETITVRYTSGGISRITLKSYDQGRERFQGETLDFIWFDEEPNDIGLYVEGLTRTNATKGILFMTFTPLLGMSKVVKRYVMEKAPGTHVTSMTIFDAEHYSDEEREAIIAAYPEHERKARAEGIPMLGSGAVFPIAEEMIKVKPFSIPNHWPRLVGTDFGYNHNFAAVWIAIDPDTDTIYVYDVFRQRESTPLQHAPAIRSKGAWIPAAWPHDGMQHDKGSGKALHQQYKEAGVNMLGTHATWPDGSNSFEAGIMEMLDRMQTGRLKIFEHLHEWFEEFRMYHRKDGKIVKLDDDALSATRYAIMMKRYAKINEFDFRSSLFEQPGASLGVLDEEMGY